MSISKEIVMAVLAGEFIADDKENTSGEMNNDEYLDLIADVANKKLDKNTHVVRWEDCTEENYWENEADIVAFPCGGEVWYYTQNNCPYGWNVLYRSGAKILHIPAANFELKKEDNE